MDHKKRTAPESGLPQEYRLCPEQEYQVDPGQEYGCLPPEYGQRTEASAVEKQKKHRGLRYFLTIPAVALAAFLCWEPLSRTVGPSGPEPAQLETLPIETAEPIPELPAGSVVLDVRYAVRDGDRVLYRYDVYTPEPSLDATQEQIDAYQGPIWPVSVYAQVSDEQNRAVHPDSDPDVWEDYRESEEAVISAAGLEGELTLTLRAVYNEGGQERQTVAVLSLEQLPPMPETYAELTPLGGNQVEFTAYLQPQSGDGSEFELETWYIGQHVHFQGETEGLSLVDDPRGIPVEYDPENGFTVRYTGGSAINALPEDAELSIYVGLRDRNTGYIYDVESAPIQPPMEPRISATLGLFQGGYADFTADIRIPETDEQEYDLAVQELSLKCYEPGEEPTIFALGGDPADIRVTGSRETGYQVHYLGPSAAASFAGNVYCTGFIRLMDRNTGTTYEAESPGVYSEDERNNLAEFPMDGGIVITVYNDTTTFDVDSPVDTGDWLTVLAVDAFSAEDFTEYRLPDPIAPAGYDFLGWVIHVGNPFDMGSEENLFEIYEGDPPVDILTSPNRFAFPVEQVLTREDVAHVPQDAEGNRYVNVHAVWTRQNPEQPLLFLDDGNGNVTGYDMDVPLASEGYLYLCRYPIPEAPEGMIFNGWYDSDGNRVDLLVCYFSFVPMNYDEEGNFTGYDWGTTQSVYLVPGWKLDPENSP